MSDIALLEVLLGCKMKIVEAPCEHIYGNNQAGQQYLIKTKKELQYLVKAIQVECDKPEIFIYCPKCGKRL